MSEVIYYLPGWAGKLNTGLGQGLMERERHNHSHHLRVRGLRIRELFVGRLANRFQQLLFADGRSRFFREFDGFVAHSSFPYSCGFATIPLVTASAQL